MYNATQKEVLNLLLDTELPEERRERNERLRLKIEQTEVTAFTRLQVQESAKTIAHIQRHFDYLFAQIVK